MLALKGLNTITKCIKNFFFKYYFYIAFFIQKSVVILHITSTLQERMSLRFLRLLIKSLAKSSMESTLPIFQFTFFQKTDFIAAIFTLQNKYQPLPASKPTAFHVSLNLQRKTPQRWKEKYILANVKYKQENAIGEKEAAGSNSHILPELLSYGEKYHNLPFHKKHWRISTAAQSCGSVVPKSKEVD